MPRRRFLLLQVRNPGDPMKRQEIECFVRRLGCPPESLVARDLITNPPGEGTLAGFDAVFLGGSGDYSVAAGGPWLPRALDVMRWLHDHGKPTFASCWGFQAFALALGGEVVTDLARAELGTIPPHRTPAGGADPVFGELPESFLGQAGHQDVVDRLPDGAIRLARSDRVENQAFTFPGKPIYCTQFHPELDCAALLGRLGHYTSYVERIAGMTFDQFAPRCGETPEANRLLRRFLDVVLG